MNENDTRLTVLQPLVDRVTCKPGWRFKLMRVQEDHFELRIWVPGLDSRAQTPNQQLTIVHLFPVPFASYNEKSWRRWIFDCCQRIEAHELGEWFVVDGERPFSPLHGPGEDPYTVHEFREVVEAKTKQDGTIE